jgi:hypothetical protein
MMRYNLHVVSSVPSVDYFNRVFEAIDEFEKYWRCWCSVDRYLFMNLYIGKCQQSSNKQIVNMINCEVE